MGGEEGGQLEVVQDLAGEDLGLRGGEEQPAVLVLQFGQGLGNVVVDLVLELADAVEAVAVVEHRLAGQVGRSVRQQHGEALEQRRADAEQQFVGRRCRSAELLQGVLDAAGDAEAGVGEGAVEVEEDIVHGCRVVGGLHRQGWGLVPAAGGVVPVPGKQISYPIGAESERREIHCRCCRAGNSPKKSLTAASCLWHDEVSPVRPSPDNAFSSG